MFHTFNSMRFRLFLAFLLATSTVVICMFVVTKLSFERSLLRYVSSIEQERLDRLARTLEKTYAKHKSWDFLTKPPTTWVEIVMESSPERPLPPELRHHIEEALKGKELPDGPGPPPMPHWTEMFELRVVLLDADRKMLFGSLKPWLEQPRLLPLIIDKKNVAWLGLIPPRIVVDANMRRFAVDQVQSLIILSLIIATLAALLAIPLAKRLVRRITTLATATNRLASGHYETRVPAEATDELGSLARDFNTLATNLETNEEMRRRWVADISHELRTPLAVLRAEVEAVQDGVRQLSKHTIDGLHGEILHLGRLVDDLYELSLADIGALAYRKENLDLGEILSQAVGSFREEFNLRNIHLDFNPSLHPMPLFADAQRLRQLLTNLLRNSLRYTDAGGVLKIEIDEQGENYLLRLQDSAPGVPDEALGRLFDRLYRVETSRNRAHGGAGLGLALAKAIVEAHDGTIAAGPSILGGLAIAITLPRKG